MTAPHVIHPTAVYLVDDAKKILRLKDSTIRREVREGRLRIAKRAGRYYILGEWLLQWLRTGEMKRRGKAVAASNLRDGGGNEVGDATNESLGE